MSTVRWIDLGHGQIEMNQTSNPELYENTVIWILGSPGYGSDHGEKGKTRAMARYKRA